jgi:hypothetical protein
VPMRGAIPRGLDRCVLPGRACEQMEPFAELREWFHLRKRCFPAEPGEWGPAARLEESRPQKVAFANMRQWWHLLTTTEQGFGAWLRTRALPRPASAGARRGSGRGLWFAASSANGTICACVAGASCTSSGESTAGERGRFDARPGTDQPNSPRNGGREGARNRAGSTTRQRNHPALVNAISARAHSSGGPSKASQG